MKNKKLGFVLIAVSVVGFVCTFIDVWFCIVGFGALVAGLSIVLPRKNTDDTPVADNHPNIRVRFDNKQTAPINEPKTNDFSINNVKEYNFHVTGTKHYINNIKKITEDNVEYSFDKDDLEEDVPVLEKTLINSDVELVPEPDNQYDSNAIRVDIHGVTVGYMKKGNCSRVKNLIASPNFISYELNEFKFGKYKKLKYDYESDKYYLEKGDYETPIISVLIFTKN